MRALSQLPYRIRQMLGTFNWQAGFPDPSSYAGSPAFSSLTKVGCTDAASQVAIKPTNHLVSAPESRAEMVALPGGVPGKLVLPHPSPRPHCVPVDRCQPGHGRSVQRQGRVLPEAMGGEGSRPAHQREGNPGGRHGRAATRSPRRLGSSPCGQLRLRFSRSQDGHYTVGHAKCRGGTVVAPCAETRGEVDHSHMDSHRQQRRRGLSEPALGRQVRLPTDGRGLDTAQDAALLPGHGRVRLRHHQAVGAVPDVVQGQRRGRPGRVHVPLAGQVSAPSSPTSHSESSDEVGGTPLNGDIGSPSMELGHLVANTAPDGGRDSSPPPPRPGLPAGRPTLGHDSGSAGGVPGFRAAMLEKWGGRGLTRQTIDLMGGSVADGTAGGYGYVWRRFTLYCQNLGQDPFSCELGVITSFLTSLFHQGLQYRTVGCYRSAISKLHGPIDGFTVGEHPAVKAVMGGVFRRRPPLPRYQQTWDVSQVLSYLAAFSSPDRLSLSQLSC